MSDAKLQKLKRKSQYDPAYRDQWIRACLRIDTPPRFQLMTSNANLCKRGQFPVNHFAGIRNSIVNDLGSEVVAYFHDWQPKAWHVLDDEIRVSHDPEDPLFKEIEQLADHTKGYTGALVGPEFTILIGDEPHTFFCGTRSIKRQVAEAGNLVGQTKRLKALEVSNGRYNWCTIGFHES